MRASHAGRWAAAAAGKDRPIVVESERLAMGKEGAEAGNQDLKAKDTM